MNRLKVTTQKLGANVHANQQHHKNPAGPPGGSDNKKAANISACCFCVVSYHLAIRYR
jgi:hypothetical protein